MENTITLIRTLPPLVAAVVWDVLNGKIDRSTIDLAASASAEEYEQYDLIRCVSAANPDYPPLQEAKVLVEEMLEAS